MSKHNGSFMDGRNGMDELNWYLFAILLVLAVIAVLTKSYSPLVVAFVLLIILVWRALSKNLIKRQRANAPFQQAWKGLVQLWHLQKLRWRDRKTHVYKVCPACHAVLRTKRVKGDKTITCPYCHNTFTIKIHIRSEAEKQAAKEAKKH